MSFCNPVALPPKPDNEIRDCSRRSRGTDTMLGCRVDSRPLPVRDAAADSTKTERELRWNIRNT